MNFMHLKYAAEIAKTGSINKAADNLYVAQPNLSRSIKELETNLGITIFERSPKGMAVTPEGETFLAYANKILAQVDELEAMYKEGAVLKQRFSISVPRASYISEAFVQFSKRIDPRLPLELVYKETNAIRAIKNMIESDYKLGIIRYAESYDKNFKETLEQKSLVYEMVAEFTYVLIMNKANPLASKKEIRYSDLRGYTEITHADSFVPSLPLSEFRREELLTGVDKRIFVFERASQFELLAEKTDTFMWVSSVPQKLLDRYGLVQKICIDNNRLYKDMLIYHKGYTFTQLDSAFIMELYRSKIENLSNINSNVTGSDSNFH